MALPSAELINLADRGFPYGGPTLEEAPELDLEPIIAGFIEGDPEREEFIVEGMIPCRSLTLLAGETGIGKSTLVQQLQVSTALGRPWVGRQTQQCRSLGIYGEERNNALHARRNTICAYERIDPSVLDDYVRWLDKSFGDPRFLIYKYPTRYSDKGEPTPLWTWLRKHVAKCEERLVILDNAGLVFSGWSPEQVTLFLLWLDEEANDMEAAVVLLHHPNKSKDSPVSGVGDWMTRPRQVYSFETPPTPDGKPRGRWDRTADRILGAVKASYIPSTDPLCQGLRLKFDGGVLKEERARWPLTIEESKNLDIKVLNLIRLAVKERDPFFRKASSPKSFPSRASRRTDGWKDYDWRELDESIKRLVNLGMALEVSVGDNWLLRAPEQAPLLGERPRET